jgi:hypothetical protein
MSHYDKQNDAQLFSALISNHGDMADLALVSHATHDTVVYHTEIGKDTTYQLAPEEHIDLAVRDGDMLTIQVKEQKALLASGLYFVDFQAWESKRELLLMQGEYRMKLSQAEGIILPKRAILDAIDALLSEEGELV